MNKYKLKNALTEIVAAHLDRREQRAEGVWPPRTDLDRWKRRYVGQNVPPPYVELNHFRVEVDQFVATILLAVHKAVEDTKAKEQDAVYRAPL